MKIHKVDKKRIYFIMDSGACGSIKREDIIKLIRCRNFLENEKVDSRNAECLSVKANELYLEELELYTKGVL